MVKVALREREWSSSQPPLEAVQGQSRLHKIREASNLGTGLNMNRENCS